jgi:hypothetical protein
VSDSLHPLLALAALATAMWIAALLRDRGGREHLLHLSSRLRYDATAFELERAGHHVNLLEVRERRRVRTGLFLVSGFVLLIALLVGTRWVSGSNVTAASVAGGFVGIAGVVDLALVRFTGLADTSADLRRGRRFVAWWLGVALRAVLATGGFYCVVRGLFDSQDLVEQVLLSVWGLLVLGAAHAPALLLERWSRAGGSDGGGIDADSDNLLLLRSFADDAMRLRSLVAPSGPQRGVLPGLRVRFEDFLVTWMIGQSGGLVSIGRPGELLPELGATRTYYPDDEWQQAVEKAAARCRAIILVAGSSDGLAWEIEQLRRWRVLRKTLILLPPDGSQQSLERFQQVHEQLSADDPPLEYFDPTMWVALGYDESGRTIHYLAKGRDWMAYTLALVYFLGEQSGAIKRSDPGALARSVAARWEREFGGEPLPDELAVVDLDLHERGAHPRRSDDVFPSTVNATLLRHYAAKLEDPAAASKALEMCDRASPPVD